MGHFSVDLDDSLESLVVFAWLSLQALPEQSAELGHLPVESVVRFLISTDELSLVQYRSAFVSSMFMVHG